MKTTISQSQFQHAFNEADRGDNFSWAGREALYDYLMEIEACGVDCEIELDVIAICCEYSEYEDLRELASEYNVDISDLEEDEVEDHIIEYFGDRTHIIPFGSGVIIATDF